MASNRIRGIEEALPEGEEVLWQGRPDVATLARRAFRVRGMGLYFIALAVLVPFLGGADAVSARIAWMLVMGAAVIGLIYGLAWLTARTTRYAVTSRRVVMQIGIAFPSVFNLPYSRVGGAAVRAHDDGTGDIAFEVTGSDRIGYVFLWPHARPWRFRTPEPMLRGLREVGLVGDVVRQALEASGELGRARATAPVDFRVLDEDETEILSNRRPAAGAPS